MNKKRLAFLVLTISIIFIACDPNRVFEENKKLDKNEWDKM